MTFDDILRWGTGGGLAVAEVFVGVTLIILFCACLALAARRRSAALRHRVWALSAVGAVCLPLFAAVLPDVGPRLNIEFSPQASIADVAIGDESAPIGVGPPLASHGVDAQAEQASQPSGVAISSDQSEAAQRFGRDSALASQIAVGENSLAAAVGAEEMVGASSASGSTQGRALPLLFGIWLLGVFVSAALFVRGMLLSRALVRRAMPVTQADAVGLKDRLCRSSGVSTDTALLCSPETSVPLAVGWLRPVVVLPSGFSRWPRDRWRVVLAHEIAHIERRDALWQGTARLAKVIYWCHPLAWLVDRQMRVEREFACDDAVVRMGEGARGYARQLVDVASSLQKRLRPQFPAVGMASKSCVERRVRAILQPHRNRLPVGQRTGRLLIAVTLMATVAISLVGPSMGQINEGETAGPVAPDGSWAKYEVETIFRGRKRKSTVIVASVGKTTYEKQVCRWIEVIEEDEGNQVVQMHRLLVPEEHLRARGNIMENALVVWRRRGEQPPVDRTALMDRGSYSLSEVFPVWNEDDRSHDPESVETKLGELLCSGWTNDKNATEIVARWWVNEKAPLHGVVRATLDLGGDTTQTVLLTDGGTGAKSRFSERGLAEPLALTPGWEWAFSPKQSNFIVTSFSDMVIQIDKDNAAFRVSLAYPYSDDRSDYSEYRPVAFDEDGKRYEFEAIGRGGGETVGLGVFRLAPEAPIEGIAYLGIELLTEEGLKFIGAQMAQAARDAGLEPLPIPTVSRPYRFSVTTTDGRTLRGEDLRGKVVLIDCWALWCAPCMKKMPQLKELYAKWHPRGFEVIGVNFDDSVETMQKAVDATELPWPQVMVPTDPEHRKLWQQASGGDFTLPRLLLIDGDGNLHADHMSFGQLEGHLEDLLGGDETDAP